MAYFNYNQSFTGYRQGPMVCFPVQSQEGGNESQGQGGLQGEITMPDGSKQSVVCYYSQSPSGDQGQQGNGQGKSGGQEQQGNDEGQGGMPTPQDILGQLGQGGNQGQQQGGDEGEGGMPTPQDILGQLGQGGNQGQQQGDQGQNGMPTPQDILGQLGQGGNQGQQQGNQGQGMPVPQGMFGPDGGQGQRIYGHPRAVIPHYMWIPIRHGFYW
ncbi:hypothetical protein WMZ97_03455 [Lentibacillus sp. N15]|uniref:hypothetical protein n=1 Tax=Lentibacillus songyuanensis TaxID=3136161 RepID=UPI0031BBCC1F